MQKLNENRTKLKSCTVLIVDDDDKQLKSLSEVLSNFFDNIVLASNGQEALEKFHLNSIDVVFSDYVMPIIDGLKLCHEIRKINKEIPIVIISNYSEREKLLGIIPFKITTYLLKPVNLNTIVETLEIVLEEIGIQKKTIFELDDNLKYCFLTKTLKSFSGEISLVKNEAVLLEIFINNINSIVTNDMIDIALSRDKPLSYQAIANIIYRLRKKISKDILLNVQSIGYILKSSSEV